MTRRRPLRLRAVRRTPSRGAGGGAVNTQADTAFNTEVAPVSPAEQWRHFDRFGPKLRAFLRDAPIDIDCAEVAGVIALFEGEWGRRAAEEMALRMYAEEVSNWVSAYRASFAAHAARGTVPHVIP